MKAMAKARIADEASLAATLRDLEEARFRGDRATRREVRDALDWIMGRHGGEGAARATLFAPTQADLRDATALLTGEHCFRGGHSAYAVAFEAARALVLWGRTGDWPAAETFAGIRAKSRQHAPRIGYYCCPPCSGMCGRRTQRRGSVDGRWGGPSLGSEGDLAPARP